jgi:uncharacterized membrane protein YgcG
MRVSRFLARGVATLAIALILPGPACAASIADVVRSSMAQNHLRAVIVQVRSNGRKNGALAFTYMSTLLLEFVDQKKVTLRTKLSKYFPNLPSASRVTLKDLSQMTSGYADYVYQPEFTEALYRDPFKQWTSQELCGYSSGGADGGSFGGSFGGGGASGSW